MNNQNDKELFKLVSTYKPTGDQPEAIAKLVEGIKRGDKEQTLLGVTGSGKTFTMANIISQVQKPTLVLAHNRPWRRSSAASFANFSQHPQSSILSATMIIISQKLISLRQTLILKRILRLMTKSTSSVILRPQPCPNAEMSLLWPAFPAFIAWVTRLITAPWLFLCGRNAKKPRRAFKETGRASI